MKKLSFCILLFLAWSAGAQNFEGTVKWSMKTDITDPATKAKMDDAKNKMNSPEVQANLKKMQEKMNDPQFKAMMDANPQMKAQMESALKMAAGGDVNSMMPSGFVIKIKGENVLTKIDGGAFAQETLYLKDKNQTYSLNRDAKTYSVLPSEAQSGQPETAPKITKTSETMKILGFNCTKYVVEIAERGRTITESIWTTTELKNFDFRKYAKAKMGKGHSIFFEGIDGNPMRVEVKEPSANMVMEITEIKPESLASSDFIIPADFKETQGMFGR